MIFAQAFPVPNASASGPVASGWFRARVGAVALVGLSEGTNEADLVMLLGSATGAEVVDPTNQNQVATLPGGQTAQPIADGFGNWAYYAVLRYPAPAGTQGPSTGVVVELQGEGLSVPVSFTWRVTLTGGVAKNLNPSAWAPSSLYAVGNVVFYPNGAYGICTAPGISSANPPRVLCFQEGVVDGAATFTVTGPAGFPAGIQWKNNTGSVVYAGSLPAVSAVDGFGPLPDGNVDMSNMQPASVYVFSAGGGTIAVASR